MRIFGLLVVASCLLVSTATAALLNHRYTFDLDANDSAGTAHGTLQGTASISENGLVLSGTNASVLLPANLLTNHSSATVEVWYSDTPVNGTNAQIFSFNSPNAQLSYALGGQVVFRAGTTSTIVNLPFPSVGGTNHLVWTYDESTLTMKVFANGLLTAFRTNVSITPALMGPTPTIRIGGGSTTNVSSNFRGKILEFRIFDGVLTDIECALLHALGPDQLLSDPATLENVRLVLPNTVGSGALFPASVYGDFSTVTNVNLSTQSELTLTSNDSNVVQVAENRKLLTVTNGTAEITAWYSGRSNSVLLKVASATDFRLVHRYSFNELTNDWILHDSAGHANGRVHRASGFPANAAFTGKGELMLRGGYASLPPGILSSLSEVTFVTWITWSQRTMWPWQRVFDFGNTENGWGRTYFYLTTEGQPSGPTTAVTTNSVPESTRLMTTNMLALNVRSFLAVVYSPAKGLAQFYVNGEKVASGATRVPLASIIDTNNWLGRSQFSQDSFFMGRYDEFRIYNGALNETEVKADFAAGPEAIGSDFALRTRVLDNELVLSWGTTAASGVLETKSSFEEESDWQKVEVHPVLSEGRYSVTLPMTQDQTTFFRLRIPLTL
jgi:hypothetical protein